MNIVIIGAGNLATQLGLALKDAGQEVVQVYSRTEESAKLLADRLSCAWTISTNDILEDADCYIFSVKDSVLELLITEVCKKISKGTFLHTAGSMPYDIFKAKVKCYGVLYPLQTFSKERKVDFKEIPIFIEGSTVEAYRRLQMLAELLSPKIYPLTSEARRYLHLAAVWACNFTNHCYTIAQDVLEREQIPFEVLLPLINETARKVNEVKPNKAQTGPAVRYDRNVIEKQINLMESSPLQQELYKLLSKSIHKMNSNKNT